MDQVIWKSKCNPRIIWKSKSKFQSFYLFDSESQSLNTHCTGTNIPHGTPWRKEVGFYKGECCWSRIQVENNPANSKVNWMTNISCLYCISPANSIELDCLAESQGNSGKETGSVLHAVEFSSCKLATELRIMQSERERGALCSNPSFPLSSSDRRFSFDSSPLVHFIRRGRRRAEFESRQSTRGQDLVLVPIWVKGFIKRGISIIQCNFLQGIS